MYICANRSISNTVFIPHTYTSQLYVHDSNSDVSFDFRKVIFYSCVHKDDVYLIMQMLIITDFNLFLQIYSFFISGTKKRCYVFCNQTSIVSNFKKIPVDFRIKPFKEFCRWNTYASIANVLLHIMLCIRTYHLSYICSMILINEHDRIRNFDRICHRHIKTFTSLAP